MKLSLKLSYPRVSQSTVQVFRKPVEPRFSSEERHNPPSHGNQKSALGNLFRPHNIAFALWSAFWLTPAALGLSLVHRISENTPTHILSYMEKSVPDAKNLGPEERKLWYSMMDDLKAKSVEGKVSLDDIKATALDYNNNVLHSETFEAEVNHFFSGVNKQANFGIPAFYALMALVGFKSATFGYKLFQKRNLGNPKS